LLPLKAGDHIWRPLPNGSSWHGLYVGQFLWVPGADGGGELAGMPPRSGDGAYAAESAEDVGDAVNMDENQGEDGGAQDDDAAEAELSASSASRADAGSSCLPHSVIAAMPAEGSHAACVARIELQEFVSSLPLGAQLGDSRAVSGRGNEPMVRLYLQRPRNRKEAVARALAVLGTSIETSALAAFPELLPWWSIFDEAERLQPGLCATRARAMRYRLTPKGDVPVQPAIVSAVLAGGAVVQKGRVVLRGMRLVKALRLTKAASTGWVSLGGFVGQAIAASVLDDGDAGTAVATTAGGWAGGLAGGGVAAAMVSSMGMEALGGGSVTGGLVACSSLSAVGAVAGAGLAFAAKRAIQKQQAAEQPPDRTSEYHDCGLRLLGGAGDVFDLFDASLEFPAEDGEEEREGGMRLAAAGWYAARVGAAN